MNWLRSRRGIAVVLLVLILVVVAAVQLTGHHRQTPTSTTGPTQDTPSADVVSLVTKYLQAREDSVGADQTSPTSWLSTVQPLTTAAWFAQLQLNNNDSTSSISDEYTVAHNNGYTVLVHVSGCFWDREVLQPTPILGAVYCNLRDATIKQATGSNVPSSDLPFGWTRNGEQPPAILKLANQSGHWYVAADMPGDQ